MKFRFIGPGKYIVGQFVGDVAMSKIHKAVVGEIVELTAKQAVRFRDRFEPVASENPTPEEIAAAEAVRIEAERQAEEARLMAELEAEQAKAEAARVEAERQAADAEAIKASLAQEQAVVQAENVVAAVQS